MPDNKDFFQQLKSGNESAFTGLVAKYRKQVLNLSYRFLLNREDAEDVSQEVFIAVFHSLKNFREESGLGTWIYRITVSKCLDELKKRSRKKRFRSLGQMIGLEAVASWLTGQEYPDKHLEAKEGMELLQEALDKLQDNQRIALTLSKIEGYDHARIAEVMQVSPTAVDSLVYRARQNLKKYLASDPTESGKNIV